MEISLDLDADALYIKFQDGKFAQNKRVDQDTIIDLDARGRLLGIELLNVSRKFSKESLAAVKVNPPMTVS